MPDSFARGGAPETFVGPPWFEKTVGWIKSHARVLLFAGVVFQLLVLVAMIAMHSAPLVFGERIWLHVQPVDPRDMFRGDYVVLGYDFSRVPPEGIDGRSVLPSWRRGHDRSDARLEDRAVYVSLEPEGDGKHYRMSKVSFQRPESGKYLKGRFAGPWGGSVLRFGIEAYYVQEGQGKELERLRNAKQLSAEIALAPWGQATLCSLK